MKEIVFEVIQEEDGGYVAEALGESMFTQADTWDELRGNVREAVSAFYFDRPAPQALRIGTLNGILRTVASHKNVSRQDILSSL